MSLLTRIRSIVRPLSSPPSSVKAGQGIVSTLTGYQSGSAAYSIANYEARVKEGYRKNELIFACVDATGNTAASATLRIYDRKTDEEVKNHPARALLMNPNPLMSEFDFWRLTIMNLKLAGVMYWQKVRNNGGQVTALWPMRPDWVRIIPDKETMIGGYEYKPPNSPASEAVHFDVKDVLVFKIFDPLNLFETTAPVQVAARIADVDNHETDMIKRLWEMGGVPLGILTTKLKLHDDDVSDIQRRWRARYGGWQKWDTPAVLDSDASYQRMQMNFAEMGLEFLDGRDETRICMVMGVPPIIIGTTFGLNRGTFSNYGEARRAWWEDFLIPQYKQMEDKINSGLILELDDGCYARWDFSKVPALQDDQNARWARATAALTAGGITVNMYLREIGKGDIGAEGEIFLRGSMVTTVPVGNPDDDRASPNKSAFKVPETKARSDKALTDYAKRMADLAAQASTGEISEADFEKAFAALIEQAAAEQVKAAGGSLDPTEIARFVQAQREYLAGFVKDVGGLDVGAARARAMMYANSTRSLYWKAASPVPLPIYPADGQTDCKGNCNCTLEFDTTSKPGYVLVKWKLGVVEDPCGTCRYYNSEWQPLEVKL